MKRRSFLIGAAALMIKPYRVRETRWEDAEVEWGDAATWSGGSILEWAKGREFYSDPEWQYLAQGPWKKFRLIDAQDPTNVIEITRP